MLADFPEDSGGVAAGGQGEGEPEERAGVVAPFRDGRVGDWDAEWAAGAFGSGVGVLFQGFVGEASFGEDAILELARGAGGLGHAAAEEGAGGGDFEGVAAGLLGVGVIDTKAGAVDVFVGEVAESDAVEGVDALGEDSVEQVALGGGEVEGAHVSVHGAPGFAGVAPALEEGLQDVAVHAAVGGPSFDCFFEPAEVEVAAGVEDAACVGGAGAAQEDGEGLGEVVFEDGEPDLPVVTAVAESLGAEVVGDAAAGEDLEDGLGRSEGSRGDVAEFDGEAVGAEVAFLELVGVAAAFEDGQAGDVEAGDAVGVNVFDAEGLACDGVGVFEAGEADVAGGSAECLGESARGFVCGHFSLFDAKVEVGAGSARLVEWGFLDEEVVRAGLDAATYAGRACGEVGEGGGGVSGLGVHAQECRAGVAGRKAERRREGRGRRGEDRGAGIRLRRAGCGTKAAARYKAIRSRRAFGCRA